MASSSEPNEALHDESYKQNNSEKPQLLDHDKSENNSVSCNENDHNVSISSQCVFEDQSQSNLSFIPRLGCSKDDSFGSSIGMTPFKDTVKSFKRGVLCSSTPVHEPPAKKHKFKLGNLTTIDEVNSSGDQDTNNSTVIENDLMKDAEEQESRVSSPVNENYSQCDDSPAIKSKLEIDSLNVDSNEQESSNVTIIENILLKDGEKSKALDVKDGDSLSKSFDKDKESEDCCNETILHKDEVSLMIDNLVTVLEKTSQDNSALGNNNLTINVDRDLSVTYRNIEEKTVDEVILAEKVPSAKVDEVIKLDFEPDREKIVEKANNLQVFVSNDEAENKDNHDPEWELFRKLETDDERYKVVRKTWKNLTIPDPKENLSSFNWRNKNSLGPLKNIDLPKSFPVDKKISNICYPCTEVFDVASKKVLDFYQQRRLGMNVDHNYEYALLTSLNNRPKYAQEAINSNYNGCLLSLDQLHSCLQERLQRYKNAKEEIEAIHKFYNGLKNREENSSNLLVLKHSERQEVLDVENMINSYSNWYKK